MPDTKTFDFEYADGIDPEAMGKPVDEPDPKFATGPKRSRTAVEYEKKVGGVLRGLFKGLAERPSTVPDAAAIFLAGPELAEKTGNLAAHDERVRKGIDWVLEGTENPYIAFAFVALPLALQIYRNHEGEANPKAVVTAIRANREAAKASGKVREWRIPFTKRTIQFRLAFQFPSLHAITNEPLELTKHVFENPEVMSNLEKEGIKVAWESASHNGRPNTKPRAR